MAEADNLCEEIATLSLGEDDKTKPKVRKDYKLNIRRILASHDAVGGMTMDALCARLAKKFGPLSDTNKLHIQAALMGLEEDKEIFIIGQNTKYPKFRIVEHPEFKGYPQEWKLNMAPKRTFKPRKLTEDEEKSHAFHITCACGRYHVQYIAEAMANLGTAISFGCECGWKVTLEKS